MPDLAVDEQEQDGPSPKKRPRKLKGPLSAYHHFGVDFRSRSFTSDFVENSRDCGAA